MQLEGSNDGFQQISEVGPEMTLSTEESKSLPAVCQSRTASAAATEDMVSCAESRPFFLKYKVYMPF